MSNVIWSIIGIAVLVHGFFYVRYGTPDPCQAAAMRLTQDEPQQQAPVVALGSGIRNADTLYRCYSIALAGPVVVERKSP